MTVDIHTLAVVLGLTQLVQILALSLQAWTMRRSAGVGWWLLWSASAAAGFAFMLLRTIPALERSAIVIQNALVVLASIFLYVGILRFLERRENRGALAAGYVAYMSALAYFVYARDDIVVRAVLTSLTLAGMAGLSALSLVTGNRPVRRGAAEFCSAVFVAHMLVCLHRAAMILAGADVTDVFGATLFNAFVYLDGILASLLWTFGLIIMVNQRASAEMAAANARWARMAASNAVGVVMADAQGRLLEVNDYYLDVLGVTRAEFDAGAVRWDESTPPEHLPADWRAIAELRERGVCTPYEKEYLRQDGSRVWVLLADAVLPGPDERILAIVVDITKRKQAEALVRRLNAELEQRVRDRTTELEAANRELEAFSYSVSHDLRAPLRAINGFARILTEDHAARLDAEGQRVLGIVRKEAVRMGHLIDDLLQFSRLGRQPLRRVPTDMNLLVREVQAELRGRAPERAVVFRLERLPVAPADPALLRQVWFNLLDNACKYTRQRHPAEIVVSGRIDGGCAVYSVKDNGSGFEMKYAAKLFGVFQRLHRAEEFEGTGVGLALVQRILHRHGGRIWAEAELDRGATFRFTLPIASEPPVAEASGFDDEPAPDPLTQGT